MQTLRGYSEQLTQAWKAATPVARFGIVLLALLCAVVIGGVGYWSSLPQYTELANGLEGTELDAIVSELDRASIKYEIRGVGDTVFVDRRYWSTAKGILRKTTGSAGESSGDSLQMFPLPDEVRQREHRRRERSLVAAIKQFTGIADAQVNLTIPEKTGFLPDRFDTPQAGVWLTLKKGYRLSEGDALAIAEFVSSAVLGLQPSDVSITDTDGNVYRIPTDDEQSHFAQQREREQFERRLVQNIQATVGEFLGADNVSVRAFADIRLLETISDETRIDKKNSLPLSETSNSTKKFGPSDPDAGSTASQPTEQIDTTTTTYRMGELKSNVRQKEMKIEKLSIAIVANANSPLLAGDQAISAEQLKSQIETLAKGASGFQEDRDFLAVELVPFAVPEGTDGVPAAAIPWDQINQILQNVSLGIAAVIAFLITLMALRRFKASSQGNPPAPQMNQENSARVTQLGQLITQNPEVFSRIIAAWADSSAGASPPGEGRRESDRKAA